MPLCIASSHCVPSSFPLRLWKPPWKHISWKVEEVTIFSHFFHAHENGQRFETRQYRNDSSGNEVLVRSAEVEYFSFEQAGGHTVFTDGTASIQVSERNDCYVGYAYYGGRSIES